MDNLPTPLNRVELYLGTAAQMPGVTPPEEPLSRLEQYLAFIAGDTSVELPAPASLCEQWLAYVAGITPAEPLALEGAFHVGVQKVDVRFFAAAAGMPGVVAPEPQNRTEQYWARLAEILPVHGVLKNATGTNITLTDVAWWRMGLERINGDTTQQTYTGKNMFNAATVVNGVLNGDGTIGPGSYRTSDFIPVQPNTEYYKTQTGSARFKYYDSTQTRLSDVYDDIPSAGDAQSFTTPANAYYIRFTMTPTLVDSVQIELGSTGTSYEPYVGGVPAPNPNYPQAINTVTGEQTVAISGPQLLSKQGMATPPADTTFWSSIASTMIYTPLTNGWANIASTAVSSTTSQFSIRIAGAPQLQASTTYTIIVEIKNVVGATTYRLMQPGQSSDTWASFSYVSEPITHIDGTGTCGWDDLVAGQYVVKAKTKSSLASTCLRMWSHLSTERSFDVRVSIIEGDHTADWQDFCGNNWKPYQKTEYKLNLVGSNLYDKNKAYKSSNDAHLDIDVEPNTMYVFSTGRAWTGVLLYDSTGTQTRKVGNDYGLRHDVVFTTRADEVKATLTFYLGAADIHTYDFSGVDFHESIELRKIGTYQDYIYKNGKDWYVHNNTSIQVPNTTNFNLWTTHPEACMYYKNGALEDALFQDDIVSAVVENLVVQPQVTNMTAYYNSYGQTNKYGFVLKTQTPGIMFQNKDKSDVNQFTSWIQANPPVVRYVLATPTDAKITNQTLISQLNALDRAILPQPVAYITASGDLPGELKISYYGEEE